MPIYEYRCSNGHTFEVIQRFSDAELTKCEECEAPVKRVFHPIAVHFKGSGFHNTDYGKRSRSKEGDSGASSSETKSEKSESKADSSKPKQEDKKPSTPDSG